MASDARRIKQLRRVAPWLLFALATGLCWTGLWLQVQVNEGWPRPVWIPDLAGLSIVTLFARIAACIALCGVLILALRPARRPGAGAGGQLPPGPRRRLALPSLLRDATASAAQEAAGPGRQPQSPASDPLARLARQSPIAATIRQRQVARRARDIIAARQGAEPA